MNHEFTKRILSSIILIPLTLFFIIKGALLFNLFILICFFITVYEWHFMTKKKSYKVIGTIFLILSFYSAYKIRNQPDSEYIYMLLVVSVCTASDIGGYVFGKIFKGPKLTKISPKKTYAGLLGAYFLSIISTIFLFKNFFIIIDIFIFTLLISTVSQLGDILISYFKRLSNIQDTGSIIPGHGGLLDRVDGMIFAFPFTYIIFLIGFSI